MWYSLGMAPSIIIRTEKNKIVTDHLHNRCFKEVINM